MAKSRGKPRAPECPYCGREAVLTDSRSVYANRSYGSLWVCWPCRAWVGCHRDTARPLGRLADAKLRGLKVAAHKAFDNEWKELIKAVGCSRSMARTIAYRVLARQMGIPDGQCHIGMMDNEQCQRVAEVCKDSQFYDLLVEEYYERRK